MVSATSSGAGSVRTPTRSNAPPLRAICFARVSRFSRAVDRSTSSSNSSSFFASGLGGRANSTWSSVARRASSSSAWRRSASSASASSRIASLSAAIRW